MPFCPEWPSEFTIRELNIVGGYCRSLDGRWRHGINPEQYISFLVESPAWSGPEFCWTPMIQTRGDSRVLFEGARRNSVFG